MRNNELKHYGVLGMKWGIRRYQNKDGSLTPAGIKRYGKGGSARYTSWSTKLRQTAARSDREDARISRQYGHDDEARYFEKSAKQWQDRADSSQKFDDAYTDYAKKTSVGKAIVGNLLMGPFAYKTYAMARTANFSRGQAAVAAVLDVGLGIGSRGVSVQRHRIREYYTPQSQAESAKSNVARSAAGVNMSLYKQLSNDAKVERQTTQGMSGSEKKRPQIDSKEYWNMYAEANNNVAAKLNPKVKEFNARWADKFEGYSDWSKSPNWDAYEKAFTDQYYDAMEEEMKRLYEQKYGK